MRRGFLVALALALGLAAYACSFPDVVFAPLDEDAGVDGAAPETDGAPADAPSDPSRDANVEDAPVDAPPPLLIDGAAFDASQAIPDSGRIDASGCTSCDCDNDTYNTNTRPGCSAATGPLDCDDDDPRTHPGAGPYAIDAEPPRNGDWNCGNGVEKLIPESFRCQDSVAALTNCSQLAGFTGVVPCGHKGAYVICRDPALSDGLGVLNCQVGRTSDDITQLCQ